MHQNSADPKDFLEAKVRLYTAGESGRNKKCGKLREEVPQIPQDAGLNR
jgi:hypothetical protein